MMHLFLKIIPDGWAMWCFVDSAFGWYSVSVPVKSYVISYNIGPTYNGTPLYSNLMYPLLLRYGIILQNILI